ncbi:hypothetical protein ACO0LM_26950 [Undibacterium sp. Di26W]|uniref:hypothetical protein n=1 Tax=Undibacterium sp. Di26W TaxID=3413035 RepID=UPI003BF42C06
MKPSAAEKLASRFGHHTAAGARNILDTFRTEKSLSMPSSSQQASTDTEHGCVLAKILSVT